MSDQAILMRRLILALIGGFAGLAFWSLFEYLDNYDAQARTVIFLLALTLGFFGPLLAMVGPISLKHAAKFAVLIGLPAAILFSWASFRFEKISDFMDTAHAGFAFLILVTLTVPFCLAEALKGEAGRGWRDYPALFQNAWSVLVRYSAAWLFVGVFWLVLMLCDQMLKLVGLEVIEWIIDIDAVPFVLTGVVFGLAIAVVNELTEYVSPTLVLRLLRLLLPLVLVIVTIFMVALPFQGLSDLFGNFSAAATLMAMTFGAATLVTVALDMSDGEAVHSPIMRWSALGLAGLMPVMAVLACYAIWLRVADYGWTPDRIGAAILGFVALCYGLFYAISLMARDQWMERIRQANIRIALIVIALGAAWMSPILNPERISMNSQISRLEDGKVAVADLDLWIYLNDWGKAGKAGIPRLEAVVPESEKTAFADLLARAETANSSYGFRSAKKVDTTILKLIEEIPTLAGTPVLTKDNFKNIQSYQVNNIKRACKKRTPLGHPGCVVFTADFLPEEAGDESVLFYSDSADRLGTLRLGHASHPRAFSIQGTGKIRVKALTLIDALHSGAFKIAPARINSIQLEDSEVFIHP